MNRFSASELARARLEQRRALSSFLGDAVTDCAAKGGLVNPKGVCCTQGMDFLGDCHTLLPNGMPTVSESDVRDALASGATFSPADPWVMVSATKTSSGEKPAPLWPWLALAGAAGLGLGYYVSSRPASPPSSHGPPRRR